MTSEPAPTALVVLQLRARAAVVDYLRVLARFVEEGEINADAVVAVLTVGDVHYPYYVGYRTRDRLHEAMEAIRQAIYSPTVTPEGHASNRAAYRQAQRDEKEKHEREFPHVCKCHQRFRTERGLAMHIARPGRYDRRLDAHAVAEVLAPQPIVLRVVKAEPPASP